MIARLQDTPIAIMINPAIKIFKFKKSITTAPTPAKNTAKPKHASISNNTLMFCLIGSNSLIQFKYGLDTSINIITKFEKIVVSIDVIIHIRIITQLTFIPNPNPRNIAKIIKTFNIIPQKHFAKITVNGLTGVYFNIEAFVPSLEILVPEIKVIAFKKNEPAVT